MCRVEEEVKKLSGSGHKGDADCHVGENLLRCELCSLKATLYCQADDAYLCRKCDQSVHGANFLAHRHVRSMLCNTCQNLTRRYLVGANREMLLPIPYMVMCLRRVGRNNYDGCILDDHYPRSRKRPFQFL
ncbi:hypothetical protein QQ045_016460 [Rhodiola kirilowii]